MTGPARSAADRTSLSTARDRLRALAAPIDRTETLPVGAAVDRLAGHDPPAPVTVATELDSEPGRTSVVSVAFEGEGSGADSGRSVRPVADEPLSTLARSDGWVVVPPARERAPAGETVSVERWETSV